MSNIPGAPEGMESYSNLPSDLASLLSTPLGEGTSDSIASAAAVRKFNYRALVELGNVSSYSMQNVLEDCPRKYQFTKMRAAVQIPIDPEDDEVPGNATFAFGHAVGSGIAVFDQTGDIKASMLACFLAWDIDLLFDPFEEAQRTGRKAKKDGFYHALWAVQMYPSFVAEETDLHEYDVVKLEANVVVDFENGHFYTGHIDELLRNRETGAFRVKENKTDGGVTVDPAKYSNSAQALSYSVAIHAHGATEYDVLYTIYSKPEQRWMAMSFVKSPLSKLEWLQMQAMKCAEIDMYSEANFFPKRGGSCMKFNRRCQFYEECDINPNTIFKMKFSELPQCESFETLEAIEHIDYRVTWSDIVDAQAEDVLQLNRN